MGVYEAGQDDSSTGIHDFRRGRATALDCRAPAGSHNAAIPHKHATIFHDGQIAQLCPGARPRRAGQSQKLAAVQEGKFGHFRRRSSTAVLNAAS